MTYIITFIYSIAVTGIPNGLWTQFQRQSLWKYLTVSLLIILPWLLVCGGQFETGTDYTSYMDTFDTGEVSLFINKREFLFAEIVRIYHLLNLPPQGLYFIFYSICFIFFFAICHKLNNKYLWVYILLYFCVSNLFFNQLNGLRQSVAVYIISYATLLLNTHKGTLKFILWIAFSSLFHASSWFALIILLFNSFQLKQGLIRALLLCSLLISALGTSFINYIFNLFTGIIPTIYLHLLEGSFNTSVGLLGLLPKFILFPLYWVSIKYLLINRNKYLSSLYHIGIFCYMFRLISIQNIIFDRLGYIFVLLSIFPLFLYWSELLKERKILQFSIYAFVPIALFFSKIILFPEKEYLYNSVFYEALSSV